MEKFLECESRHGVAEGSPYSKYKVPSELFLKIPGDVNSGYYKY